MSDAVVRNILINMTAQTEKFSKDLNKSTDNAGFLQGALGGLTKSFPSLQGISTIAAGGMVTMGAAAASLAVTLGVAVVAGAAAAAAAVTALAYSLGSEAFTRIDDLADTASKLGTTTKGLSELQYAADISDASVEGISTAIGKLNINLGQGKIDEQLAKIGLNAKELKNQDPAAAFTQIIKKLGEVPNYADRAGLAVKIFGKSATEILNLVNNAGNLDGLLQDSAILHNTINDLDATAIGIADQNFKKLGYAVKGVGNDLAIGFSPAIALATTGVVQWIKETRPAIGVAVEFGKNLLKAYGPEWLNNAIKGVEMYNSLMQGLAKSQQDAAKEAAKAAAMETEEIESKVDWQKLYNSEYSKLIELKAGKDAAQRYDLKQQGLGEKEIDIVQGLRNQIKMAEEAKKKEEELTKTVSQNRKNAAIEDKENWIATLKDEAKFLTDSLKEPQFATIAMKGSAEARKLELQHTFGTEKDKKEKLAEDLLKEAERQTKELKKIRETKPELVSIG